MRIAIFGSGGVGGIFGACLAQAGADVRFIARGKHLEAIRSRGLLVETPQGELLIPSSHVAANAEAIGPVDVVLLCVKAWQLEEAALALKPLLGPDTFVAPMQNAIEAPEILSRKLGDRHVVASVCYTTSFIVGPGHIRSLAGTQDSIVFAELDNRPTRRCEEFLALLERAPIISGEIPEDIQYRRWKKFVWISSASAQGAATRLPAHLWRDIPETRRSFTQALAEACSVGNAHRANLTAEDQEELSRFLDSRAEGFTTSMQRDIIEGRPSEVDFQIGSIVRMGSAAGIPTPVSEVLYSLLLPLERQARERRASEM